MSTVVVGTVQSNSTSPPTFKNTSGTEIGTLCRAFVNFNGTTVTNPASMTGIRGSFNVSSILDNGTGDYTVNFTTAMPDANYAAVAIAGAAANDGAIVNPEAYTTNSFRIIFRKATVLFDYTFCNIAIFR